jgi:hypothetical protein
MIGLATYLVLSVSSASAFVRETVEDEPDIPLFWPDRDVLVFAAGSSSEDLTPAEVETALIEALAAWQTSACTDIFLNYGGPAGGTETNFVSDTRDGENRVVWREGEWPGDPEALAITTLIYRTATGEILDGDIDVNGTTFTWSSHLDPMPVNDAQNTLAHEIGHLIGFAHTSDTEATMFGNSSPGDVAKRDLALDDLQGVCFVYPAGAPTPSGQSKGAGFVGTCSSGGESALAALGPVLAALIARSRQRARRTDARTA